MAFANVCAMYVYDMLYFVAFQEYGILFSVCCVLKKDTKVALFFWIDNYFPSYVVANFIERMICFWCFRIKKNSLGLMPRSSSSTVVCLFSGKERLERPKVILVKPC